MHYRKLGRSDLSVSEIGLGSWLTYSGGVDRKTAEACIQKAFEVGINFIDTSNIYGRGAAETFLGEVLGRVPRQSYVLATKLFFPMTNEDRGLSAKQIKKQLDASLARLKTDYVDLYQCHRYDPQTPLSETMEALTRAVDEGKARYIGFSEWSPDQIRASLKLPGARFVSSQPQYSLLHRAIEKEVIPLCQKEGIGQIVWSPLAQGVLTGKYRPGLPPPADSRAQSDEMGGFFHQEGLSDRVLKAVQELSRIAKGLGLSTAQLSLAWVLRQNNVASAIIGATKPSQIEENAKASGVKSDVATVRQIDALFPPG